MLFQREQLCSHVLRKEITMFENAIGLKQKYRNGDRILGVSMPPDTQADRFEAILDQDD